MKTLTIAARNAVLPVLVMLLSAGDSYGEANDRVWTVQALVERTHIVRDDFPMVGTDHAAVVFSPDQSHFFALTRRSIVDGNRRVFALHVYDVALLRRAFDGGAALSTAEIRSVQLTTSSACVGIAAPRWVTPSRIAFLGCRGDEPAQVYSWLVDTGELVAETSTELGVVHFSMTADTLIYLARSSHTPPHARIPPLGSLLPPSDAPELNLFDLLRDNPSQGDFSTFLKTGGSDRRLLRHSAAGHWLVYRYFISPDARYAVLVVPLSLSEAPSSWRSFEQAGAPSYWSRFIVIDLSSGSVIRAVDAPTAEGMYNYGSTLDQTQAIWSRDSRRVLLVNTAIPNAPRNGVSVVMLDIYSGQMQVGPPIDTRFDAPSRLTGVEWDGQSSHFTLQFEQYTRDFDLATQQLAGPQPTPRDGYQSLPGSGQALTLRVREDANTPPDIVVSDSNSEERALTDLNPQIRTIIAPGFRPFSWTSANTEWDGGLLLPLEGCVACPLAVQIGYWDWNTYAPDSTAGTNFAAQALAARGVAVLSIDLRQLQQDAHSRGVIGEANGVIQATEDAVLALADQGIVDRRRVALSGFSRSAQYIKVAITRPQQRIIWAAAMTGDGGDSSYGPYGLYAAGLNVSLFQEEIESNYGGAFWQNKRQWMQSAPGFNLERARTPLMLEPHSLGSLILDWEFYSGLRIMNRPVDIAYIPASEHWLTQPRHIAFSQQISVDWFLFWLLGFENPESDPTQYDRWRRLRVAHCEADSRGGGCVD